METWIIFAVLAALSWGTYIVLNKVAISRGVSPFLVLALMAVGIVGLFAAVFFVSKPSISTDSTGLALAVIAGGLWGVGQLFAVLALANKAPVAKLAPIYNTNTLVAVLLGIILLKELPAGTEKIKVLIGAVLIVVGGVLVSS